jgi:hypothetical protein
VHVFGIEFGYYDDQYNKEKPGGECVKIERRNTEPEYIQIKQRDNRIIEQNDPEQEQTHQSLIF